MLLSLLISLHTLSAVLWVGGMFFAYLILRPVAASLFEPPIRLTLWSQVFKRFFPWVWLTVITLLISGICLIYHYGGMSNIGVHVHIMLALGLLMMLLFMHLYFSPYRRLNKAVNNEDWPTAGIALNKIRQTIAVNLVLGLLVVIIASGGRFF
jgi:uncharacterized membrane protein